MNRTEAIQTLKTYPADLEIGTEYDDDPVLRDALATAIPGFEYPDWCTATIKRAVNAAGRLDATPGQINGGPHEGQKSAPGAVFSGPAGPEPSPGQNSPQNGPQNSPEPDRMAAKLVRAVLIDPHTKTVSYCMTTGELQGPGGLYDLIGCELVECVHREQYDGLQITAWVDEEGMLKDWDTQGFSLCPFYPEPLAGKVVLMAEVPHPDAHTNPDLYGATVAIDIPMNEDGLRGFSYTVRWLHQKVVEVTAPYVETLEEDGTVKREPIGKQTADGKWTYGVH